VPDPAPEPVHLDRKGRHPDQYQHCGENNHSGGKHGGAVRHGASNDQDQSGTAACHSQHGHAPQPGTDVRRPQAMRQADQPPLLGNLELQLPQPALEPYQGFDLSGPESPMTSGVTTLAAGLKIRVLDRPSAQRFNTGS
jgi:hypothetical protein